MTTNLYAELLANAGQEDHVAEMVERHSRAVRAEPGNELFLAYRWSENSAKFFILERYRDQEAFDAHISSKHSVAFNEEIGTYLAGGSSSLTWLEPLSV